MQEKAVSCQSEMIEIKVMAVLNKEITICNIYRINGKKKLIQDFINGNLAEKELKWGSSGSSGLICLQISLMVF